MTIIHWTGLATPAMTPRTNQATFREYAIPRRGSDSQAALMNVKAHLKMSRGGRVPKIFPTFVQTPGNKKGPTFR